MNNQVRITVFTPAYNRAHTLSRTYESLKKQKNKNFRWLIIDDGSTDNTQELVNSWINNNLDFEIQYIYKENGGMHTAHNVAYRNIDTELNICIDSDDCLAKDAIDKILNFWDSHEHSRYAGIIGLDADLDGNLIGKDFGDIKETTLSGYYDKGGKGDKKLVYRTDIIKQYPEYPVFEGERYVGLNYKYILIDQDYKLLVLNDVLCNVEYQADGSSHSMWKQYYKNPQGFAFLRKFYMQYNTSLKRNIMDVIHYVSSSKLAGNKHYIQESPRKLLTILMIPFGYMLNYLVKCKSKETIISKKDTIADKHSEDKYPLLLTGTIDPSKYDGEVKSVTERLKKYEYSITKYICDTQFNPIIFVENSDYPFDVEKFEKIAKNNGKEFEFIKGTICKNEVKQHGKGYGDALLIYEGLTKSRLLENIDIFYKMTGRIFLKNSSKILKTSKKHRNEFICYDGIGWCMTYIFKSNKKDYLHILGKVYEDCDDKSLRDIEICFWLRLQNSNIDIGSFSEYPDIEGNMGETATPYTRSQIERFIRSVMIKMGLFTMNSKSGKLFWGIYNNILKKKPYVTKKDKI